MRIAKVSHVPIREPMFVGGILSQAWILFFEQLARGIDVSAVADVLTQNQKSHELPNNAMSHQAMLDNSDVLPMVGVADGGFDVLERVIVYDTV